MANAQDSAALHKDPWYNEVNIDEVCALIKLAVENIKSECDTLVETIDNLNKLIQDLQKIQDEMI